MFGVADETTFSEESATAPAEEPVGILHSLHSLLVRLVRNGARQFAFDYEERAAGVFAAESSLLEVLVPCLVYGDLHGHYFELHRWTPVFFGDFVERGTHGVEVALLKLQFAERVHVVRGNHEEESPQPRPSFYDEMPRCTTTRCSSAPDYKGSISKDVNMDACLETSADMRVSIKQLQVSVAYRRPLAERGRRHTPRFVEKKTVNL
ncbi:Serine/threonine protein phosphatase PP1 [Aphelenchoides fujianensis]|nr:Serine/threonine protein phosphatase PP1 [Aphelenchoides fujianensis]